MATAHKIAVPQIRDIENERDHALNVQTLATAMCCEGYVSQWSRDNDRFFVPPRGIKQAVDTVYEKLSQHPLIGKYVIPTEVNDNWLGIQADHIFSANTDAVNSGTSKAISWEDAVMAASLFLRQKYLEIIGDLSLWNMNASIDSPGVRQPAAAYHPGTPEKGGLSADGDDTDADGQPRIYFLQNRRDYRLLLPPAVRALVQGNVDLKKATALPARMTTTPFSGFSKMEKMVVALGGIQYRTVYVDGAPNRNQSSNMVELGEDGKPTTPPPDYTQTMELTPMSVEVKPIIGLMLMHQCDDRVMTIAETGGITFVKQPNVTGSSAEQDMPWVPSDNFFHGTPVVDPVDAVNLLIAVRMANVLTFGEIRDRIADQKYSLAKYKVAKSTSNATFTRDQQSAVVVNGRNVPFEYLYPEPSFTMFKSQYQEDLREADVLHYAFTKIVHDYTCAHNSSTLPLRLKVMKDVAKLSQQERERRQERYHRSCSQFWDDCTYSTCNCIGITCSLVFCGEKDWCESDLCECTFPPKNGLCGLLCGCFIWRPIWCIRNGRCDCDESTDSSCCNCI